MERTNMNSIRGLTDYEKDQADAMTRRLTAFTSFRALIHAEGGYVPSLTRLDQEGLANYYDRAQAYNGDNRRAFRG